MNIAREDSTMNEELNIYQKVAQFLINVRTTKPREAICHALVVSVLVDEEAPLGVNQVVSRIQGKWKIKVPPERVSKSLKSLHPSGVLQKEDKLYFMNDQQKEEYRQTIKNRVAFFEEVEQDWLDSMERIKRCKKLTGSERSLITEDFRSAINRLCDRKGTKIEKFLSRRANELEYTFVGREIISCLPPKDSRPSEILSIEKEIFPLFFDRASEKRAQYIAGLAQTYIRKTIFDVEARGRTVFEAKMQSLNVYLDTMMVFRLLGLNGRQKQEAAELLFQCTKTLA